MLKFLLIVNRQGQLRVSRYWYHIGREERVSLERRVIQQILTRTEKQCSFLSIDGDTVVFRRYVNLYFIMAADETENEMAVYELLQNFAETMDKYFHNVSEMDMIFNIDRVHMILDEMITEGYITDTSQPRILSPIQLLDAAKK